MRSSKPPRARPPSTYTRSPSLNAYYTANNEAPAEHSAGAFLYPYSQSLSADYALQAIHSAPATIINGTTATPSFM
jgi:hypothetical protein